MQFLELQIENYGVYIGRHILDLRTEPNRPIILIGGMNGYGKTTMLEAIQLALYGKRANISNRTTGSWQSYLSQAISRASNEETIASVGILFALRQAGELREYQVTRSWWRANSRVKESIRVSIDGTVDRHISENWDQFIEELLPLEVASLFLFDGEKIESLADPETAGSVIRTAVDSLLGVNTLTRLRNDLKTLQRRQPVVEPNPLLAARIRDTTLRLTQLENDERSKTEHHAAAIARTEVVRKEHEKNARIFRNEGGALFQKRTEIQSELAVRIDQKKKLRDRLREIASDVLPLVHLVGKISAAKDKLAYDEETRVARQLESVLQSRDALLLDQLPQDVRDQVSTVLSEDRDRRERELSVRDTPIIEISAIGKSQIDRIPHIITKAQSDFVSISSELSSIKHEISDLEKELSGMPDEEVASKLLDRLADSEARLQQSVAEETELRLNLDQLHREISDTKTKLSKFESERLENELLSKDTTRILDHSERVRETLREYTIRLKEKHIGRIESAILEGFKQLLGKDNLISGLKIDPESGRIDLLSRTSVSIPSQKLSAGERQLLAVSVLWGLARVAGHRLPTVIDTPLGRLDSKHRDNLARKYFPYAGKQVLLLSTDKEIDADLKRTLEKKISKSYRLEHSNESGYTSIVNGYWWDNDAS